MNSSSEFCRWGMFLHFVKRNNDYRLLLPIFTAALLTACQTSEPLEPVLPKKPKQHFTLRGYIDKTGNFAIQPQFVTANSFSEGLAHVCDPRGSYIDKSGNFLIKEPYYVGGDFHEGLAWVAVPKTNWKDVNLPGDQLLYGFIDKAGKMVIPPKFRLAGDFSEGLAMAIPEGAKTLGFIDKKGKMVIGPRYTVAMDSPEADLPHFKNGCAQVTNEDNLTFYIDKKGSALNRQATSKAKLQNSLGEEGLKPDDREGRHGYADASGKIVIPCQWDKTSPFHGGMAAVRQDKKIAFINKSGKVVIPFTNKYEFGNFQDGLCLIREKDDEAKFAAENEDWPHSTAEQVKSIKVPISHGNWGFMDKSGKIVIPMKFPYAEDFSDGLAAVDWAATEEEVKKIKFPFEYSVENNALVFPMKFTDEEDDVTKSSQDK